MGKTLRKISASLLFAFLLFTPSLPAYAGGTGCVGRMCQAAVGAAKWASGYHWMSAAGKWGYGQFSELGNRFMHGPGGKAMGVAFGPWMQRNVWEPMDQTPLEWGAPGPFDNAMAIGMVGTGKLGKSVGRFVSKWMKLGIGSRSWEVPGEVLTHGGASSASKGVDVFAETAISRMAVSSTGETVDVLARTAAISTKAPSLGITKEIARQNRAIVLRDVMEVAQGESIGGNAGRGRLAVNLHVDPSTGAIRLIGNDVLDPRAQGTTIVTLLLNNIVERQQGGMKVTTGFHSIGNAGKLDPTISFHIEELAGELFPMKTDFFKF